MNRLLVAFFALAFAVAGCGGDGATGPVNITSITISSPPATLGAIGESVVLTATGRDDRGRTSTTAVFTWSSSNSAVATVSNGTVTAVGNGTATISASSGSATGNTQITVQQRVSQLTVSFPSDTLLTLGDTARATAQARDSRGNTVTGATFAWTSSNSAVAVIDANGLITALSDGSSSVRASVDGTQGERTLHVKQRAARLVITRQPEGARAGVAMSVPPSAEVQDARGNRVLNDNTTVVTASIITGGGEITAGATKTASGGAINFTGLAAGGTAGPKVIQLSAPSLASANTDVFTLGAGDPALVVVVAGNNQTAPAGTQLPGGLTAGVRDSYGNGVPSSPLTFSVLQGGGTLNPPPGLSDQNGNMIAAFTLSRYAGVTTVRATSSAAPQSQALFTVTSTPNGTIRGNVSATANFVMSGQATQARTARARAGASRTLTGFPSSLPPVTYNSAKSAAASQQISATTRAASAAASAVASTDAAEPGELLVRYRGDRIGAPAVSTQSMRQSDVVASVSASLRQAAAAAEADGTVQLLSVSPAVLTARVRVQDGVSEADAIARLRSDPRVLTVERNFIMRSFAIEPTPMQRYLRSVGVISSGPRVSLESQLSYTFAPLNISTYPGGGAYPGNTLYAYQSWHYNLLGLPRAWEITQGSPSVLVAVVDDGIRFDHPSMAGVLTNDGYDFVPVGSVNLCAGGSVPTNGDGDGPDPDPTQPSSRSFNANGTCVGPLNENGNHGLHVAATIGATRQSPLVGVNWNARIRPVRALGIHGSANNYTITQAILYAAGLPADDGNGGTVVPQGGPARVINMSLGGTNFSFAMADAVKLALDNGSLLIAAAGNANSSVPNYPASYPEVMSISAIGPTLQRASYSSYGNFIDLTAPGGETQNGSTHGVFSATWNYVNNTASFDGWNGTSMATPHVSGVAALMFAQNPALGPAEVWTRMMAFAVDLGLPGPDTFYGAGLVNARNAMTLSMSPTRRLLARLVHAPSGTIVQTVVTGTGGSFEFNGLPDGPYWIFAGHDEGNDGLAGMAMRAWGAYGGAATPIPVIVDGASIQSFNFAVDHASEVEPNGTPAQADELVVNGYMIGTSASSADDDFYRLRIAQAGTYNIRVTGHIGACGFALEADPILSVYTGGGSLISTMDDIDLPGRDYCSSLSLNLPAGDYLVRVNGYSTGRYVVSARRQ